jgi:hypothetical protein
MTDGLNLTGFNETKPSEQHTIGEQYAAAPGAAFPSTDKSTQDSSGVGQGGK